MAIKKQRSPSYPGITLEDAIQRAKTFFKHEGKHEALVPTALAHWGYAAKSSAGLISVAALKAYGLMADKGSGDARMVSLTPFGLSIIMDERIVSPDRDKAIKQAALTPKIMAELWAKYGTDLPSRDTLRHFLRVEKEFTDSAVSEVLKVYTTNLAYAGLTGMSQTDSEGEEEDGLPGENEETQGKQGQDGGDGGATTSSSSQEGKSFRAQVRPGVSGGTFGGEEIANYRVSKGTTIRLLAIGPYSRKSIESLVKQLELALELGNFDDLEGGDDSAA